MFEPWNEKEVFLAALALTGADRELYLASACPDDQTRARIMVLLSHHSAAEEPQDPQSSPLPPLSELDQYRIERVLGEGGMGTVYLAEDTKLSRKVALKVLAPHLSRSAEAVARFQDEAKHAASIHHPGIIPVYHFGKAGSYNYLVSEYVAGLTLTEVIANEKHRRQTSPAPAMDEYWVRRVAGIVAQVADAIEHAHKVGIIHRDVKPSNIILDGDGRARLTDFGIAKHLVGVSQATQTHRIGSCHYMSPEQAALAGIKIDHRTDIFSLGVVLYELLVLALPFNGKTVDQVLAAVSVVDPVPPSKLNRKLPRQLEIIAAKAMEKSREQRYQSAAALSQDLQQFLLGGPIVAKAPSLARRTRQWLRRNRVALNVAGTGAAVLASFLLLWGLITLDRASRCSLSITSNIKNAQLSLRPSDPTDPHSGTEQNLGSPPVTAHLPIGPYRLTVRGADGAFNETSVLLVGPQEPVTVALNAPVNPSLKDMVLIAAGDYRLGEGRTARTVTLRAFYIQNAEVSNAEFREFVRATGHREPFTWREFKYDEALADRPVVGVSWEDAQAFARWSGRRLPTEDEWEAAMRSTSGNVLPWTQPPPSLRLATLAERDRFAGGGDSEWYASYVARSMPVRSFPELCTAGGLYHGATNVHEFTDTVLGGPSLQTVVKGASWIENPEAHNFASQRTLPVRSTDAIPLQIHSFDVGFRCARSVNQ